MDPFSCTANGRRAGWLRQKCVCAIPQGAVFVAHHQSSLTASLRCVYRCQYRFLDTERRTTYGCGANCEDWYPHAEAELHVYQFHKECLGIDKIASDSLRK